MPLRRLGPRIALLGLLLGLAAGCLYDEESARGLIESRRILPKAVEAEVARILKLYEGSLREDETGKIRPVPDAFNDLVSDKHAPHQPVLGGSIRVQLESEPKRLNYQVDNSSVTRTVCSYVYRALLYSEPATGEVKPDLAASWDAEDVVWLRGRREGSAFEAREKPEEPAADNDYLVGRIVPESVVWADEAQGLVEKLTLIVDGTPREVPGSQMRVRSNADGSYKRMFDRQVVFTFRLRQDVKWHDGKPFTAKDVVFTLDLIKNPYIPEMTVKRGLYESVKHWEALDEFTVRVWLDEQYFKAIELFTDGDNFFMVLPRHVYWPEGQSFTDAEFAKHFRDHDAIDEPVGTGPYAVPSKRILARYNPDGLDGWRKNTYVRLLRTGEFYEPSRAGHLDEIRFLFISTQAQTLQALQAGDIDFTPRWLGAEELFKKSLSGEFKSRYAKGLFYTGNYTYIAFNLKKPYFQDVRVRQALTMLLDRESLLKNISYGVGLVVSGPQYYFGPAYDRSIAAWPYDRKRAIALLNEAGWIDTDGDGLRDKDALPFEIELMASTASSIVESMGAVLAEELRTIGIGLRMRRLEWQSLLEHIHDRKFDLYSLGWATPLESDSYELWHSSQWADKGQNTPGYNDAEADKLILAIRRELDGPRRFAMQRELHAKIHRDAPYIFLFCQPNRTAYAKRYRNVKFYPKLPGYTLLEWYVPEELQTPQERERRRKMVAAAGG